MSFTIEIMKKTIAIVILAILVALIALVVWLNFSGNLYFLNSIFIQNPDISCKIDSDCKLYVHPAWMD